MAQSAEIMRMLKKQSFFSGLSDGQLSEVAKLSRMRRVKEGEELAKEGDAADEFYIVKTGAVSISTVVDGKPISVTEIESGRLFGWSWLISPYKWTFSAYAVEDSQLLAVQGKALREKCEEDKELGYLLIKKVAETTASRLIETRKQLADYYRRYKNDLKMW